jgi:histidinol phosphatase-like enzyme
MRAQYEPYVHQIQTPWRSLATGARTLRIFDKDKTLVYNPNGGIPKAGEQKPIQGIREKLAEFKVGGDLIAITTNQAGLTTKNRETGAVYKTIAEFREEVLELWQLFPEIDYLVACPDMNGRVALQFNPSSGDFDEISGSDCIGMQPFRKPAAGMYELIFQQFIFQFKEVYAYGDSQEDRLVALAADVPFQHIHDLIYGD